MENRVHQVDTGSADDPVEAATIQVDLKPNWYVFWRVFVAQVASRTDNQFCDGYYFSNIRHRWLFFAINGCGNS